MAEYVSASECTEAEFQQRVIRMLTLLRPMEREVSELDFVSVLLYVAGMFMSQADVAMPAETQHRNLAALRDGYVWVIENRKRNMQ